MKSKINHYIKKNYLFYPEELRKELKLHKLFLIFDEDKSNALDLSEMIEMF
jgi:hypothetical protein